MRLTLMFLFALSLLAPDRDASAEAGLPEIRPTSPPSLMVVVGKTELRFDPPETHEFQAEGKDGELPDAPKDYTASYEEREMWPNTLSLSPAYDPTGTHILGGLYRAFRPETVEVRSAEGVLYERDKDYKYQEDWGRIANIDGRMEGALVAKAVASLPRLDLIQADAAGRAAIKKGESAWVCPSLPQPDSGHTALAGVYIAPWSAARNPHFAGRLEMLAGATEYAITSEDINRIEPALPIQPLHPENLAGVLSKLRLGGGVKIALLGDSITLGAESTRWWNDKYDENSKTWKGRFIHGLRQRFPKAQIEPIEAFRGGVTVRYGLEKLPEVLGQKPDLVVVAFGANDADHHLIKEGPRILVEEFAGALGAIADKSKAAGADVLFVTTFPPSPWLKNGLSKRIEADFNPVALKVADGHGAAVADVHREYLQFNSRGIPWWSQNHNGVNHPGDLGHSIYAETILRCFPE